MAKVSPKNVRSPALHALGRQPEEYREWLRARIAATKHRNALIATLENDQHPHFATITQFTHKMAYGAPTQQVVMEDVTPTKALAGEALADLLLNALPLLLQGRPLLAKQLTGQAAVDAEYTIEE